MRLLTHTAIGLGLVLAPFATPIAAHAIPLTCEHRGTAHVERHGGIDNDNAYHVSRGELPNCDKGDADSHPVVTPTAPTTYVPVPVQTEEDEDDDDHHHWHRKNKWWRDD
ncbi:Uncharacterised protein [Mycobacteroides abscessus subsp. massiliense]|nr:Uncharacterised protein [Mycobacteroides abscessus subsp. massiliense]SKH39384.1 Uncharacterised protein [Mycobacteroides abscessus subsp. massiliense]SKH90058.1 Uncharacterised protein [Mycobacteroides abscessus subsp. massiliense]SKK83639.1 Uncharacterised protein [Mycobacteroides abscessus subsp. massiliense]SKK90061.1 Uncharacterised protein [Mycobacteroides abscessus subsp. massiliense]